MNIAPWPGIALVAVAACSMLLILDAYRRLANPDPEWLRKLAHVGTGALSLTLPWLFHSRWPVFAVCGASAALLVGIRSTQLLRKRMGGVLHSVDRDTHGDIYFPISVAILYGVSHGDKILYSVPVLLLTLADTVAALAGVNYGKHEFAATGAHKSMEGSVAFFTVAFLSVHIPLLLWTNVGRAESLLIGGTMGLLVMLLEAISWHGVDNILVPLGGFIMLKIYLPMRLGELSARFAVALLILVAVVLYRKWTTLEASALLCSALVLYVSWAVGGWQWVLAPATLLAVYAFLAPRQSGAVLHNVFAVISVASAGLAWLFLAKVWQIHAFLFPFDVAYASHLVLLAWTLAYSGSRNGIRNRMAVFFTFKAWLLVFMPFVAIFHFSRHATLQALIGLPLIATGVTLFIRQQPHGRRYPLDAERWVRQAILVATVSSLALLFL
jgi:phytol kinase